MPKKIRELKQMLTKAEFVQITGKDSHSHWIHPLFSGKITLSGKLAYQQYNILA
ncbi:MAG: type II toxin-antitoxin system HicA family toxin [Dolichospermum sp.]